MASKKLKGKTSEPAVKKTRTVKISIEVEVDTKASVTKVMTDMSIYLAHTNIKSFKFDRHNGWTIEGGCWRCGGTGIFMGDPCTGVDGHY